MEQRLSFVTLGVRDLATSRRFYVDGLGWEPIMDLDEVVMMQVAPGVLLALFPDLETDIAGGQLRPPMGDGGPSFALAHNLWSEEAVDDFVERMVVAGGTVLKPPQRADFGGYHAYVADPEGFRWEIAYNSGLSIAPDGTVTIGPVT